MNWVIRSGVSAARTRVVIAEDHTLVREGMGQLLAAEFEVVGLVEDGRALVQAAESLQPDLVLLDISMPQLNGLEAARQVVRVSPQTRLIFVTIHSDAAYVQAAFAAGAHGYVVKSEAASGLIAAMHEVLAGRRHVSKGLELGDDAVSSAPEPLSARQREILQLVAEGQTARAIGGLLGISHKTVEFHKAAIMRVLGMHTTAELTRYALERGIIGVS